MFDKLKAWFSSTGEKVNDKGESITDAVDTFSEKVGNGFEKVSEFMGDLSDALTVKTEVNVDQKSILLPIAVALIGLFIIKKSK